MLIREALDQNVSTERRLQTRLNWQNETKKYHGDAADVSFHAHYRRQ